jgi:hypothetical protein
MNHFHAGICIFCGIAALVLPASARAGCNELTNAVNGGNYTAIDQELGWGTYINCLDANGNTPLHAAIYALNSSMVTYLLGRGADVNAKDSGGTTPLATAIDGFIWLEKESESKAASDIADILEKAGGRDEGGF